MNRWRKLLRIAGGVLLVLAALSMLLYWQLPNLLQQQVSRVLLQRGIEVQALAVQRPGTSHWHIKRLHLAGDGYQLQVREIDLRFTLSQLLDGELESVAIQQATMQLAPAAQDDAVAQPKLPDRLDPGYWFAQLPWRQLSIAQLALSVADADLSMQGSITQSRSALEGELVTTSPAQFAGQRLSFGYTPTAGLKLTLGASADQQPIRLTSRFGRDVMDVQLQATVRDDLARLLVSTLGAPALAVRGKLSARTRVPWPLPSDFDLHSLSILGQIDFDVQDAPALALVGVGGLFSLQEGLLEWTVDSGSARIADVTSGLVLECHLLEPLLLRARAGALDVSDGLGCRAHRDAEQLSLDLRSLRLEQPADPATAASLAFDLGFAAVLGTGPVQGVVDLSLLQVSDVQIDGHGAVRLHSPLLASTNSDDMRIVPLFLRYWPEEARGELDAQLEFELAQGLLSVLDLAEPGALDLGGAQLKASAAVRWQPEQFAVSLDGQFDNLVVHGDPAVPTVRPLRATFQATLEDAQFELIGELQAASLGIPILAQGNLTTGSGSARSEFDLAVQGPLLADLFLEWGESFDLTAGQLSGSFDVGWQPNAPAQWQGKVQLAGAKARYDDYLAEGIDTQVELRSGAESFGVVGQQLHIGLLDVGFPVTDVVSSYRVSGAAEARLLHVEAFGAEVLGGRATIDTASIDLVNSNSTFSVVLTGLSLKQVLALEGDDISGTGLLDGRLPVTINAGAVRIDSGRVEARPAGGRISIATGFTAPTGQPGLDFAVQALSDFRYSELGAAVDYATNGELLLGITLKGSNPAVENGRAIHYNLNVTENIPSLLESLQADALLTDRIQDKVERKVNR